MSGTSGINNYTVNNYYSSYAQASSSSSTLRVTDDTQAGSCASAASSADPNSAGSVSISPFGQLLGDLQELQSKDPTKVSELLNQFAAQLQSKAEEAGPDDRRANFLNKLAEKFQSAASSGDLSQLQFGGHHHHPADNDGGAPPAGGPPAGSSGPRPSGGGLSELLSSLDEQVTAALGE